ncbi:ABC transporter permease [Antricoccus suffuscus]|uniref:ABC transporter permease n=1 Tax=Antricoccus suffuscus TaxID=1629062 RepID=UPI001EE058F3|nr:iron ABC transporter permease [Antricoccus suffuscus]
MRSSTAPPVEDLTRPVAPTPSADPGSVQKVRRRRRHPPMLVAAAIVVAAIALIPLGFILGYTISIGPSTAAQLIFRPRIGELLWNTTRLTVGAMTLSIVLGVSAAWLVERSNLPFRRTLHILLAAPLAIPAFVNSYAWISVLPGANGYSGALLVVTLSYYPLVYLPAVAALRGLDPALEETAAALGLSRWRTFLRVVVPQLRPAVFGGCLLVGLHLLAEFGALQMVQFPTFTTAIYDQYQSTFNGPAANMIAGVLVLCGLLLVLGELRLRGRARYARVGRGSARPAVRARLGRLRIPSTLYVFAIVAVGVGVPVGSLIYWLSVGASTHVDTSLLITTTMTSVGYAAAAAAVAVVFATPVAWLCVRHPGKLSTVLERSTYFGNALPGIVVALALVTITIRVAPAVYQSALVVIIAYIILFLPRAMVNMRSALGQAPPVLDDVAHSLGLSRLGTFRRVTLPLIAPGIGAGAALVFLAAVTELTATLLLAPIGTRTLATQFWSFSDSIAYGAAAPYAAVMILISAPATFLLTRHARSGLIE